ncbi:hypothetical protein H4S14_000952 [Agrobacterium vitis]|nr:hypothetical protein [Agrobacterium vitis]MBE1437221.1 hypothetical protein [Agrobacterium vitis]
MLLTKHCTPENKERMLRGHFRIGTHGEYSKGESTGLLSDTAEGVGATHVVGDLFNWSGSIDTNTFSNVTIAGALSGTSIDINERINCNIFCASRGGHSAIRHKNLMNGIDEYKPNPSLTEYIEIHRNTFLFALKHMSDHLFGEGNYWISKRVVYKDRYNKIDSAVVQMSGLNYNSRQRLIEQAFTKPDKFSIEDEWRYVLIKKNDKPEPNPIYTSNLPQRIIDMFRESIFSASHNKI